MLENRHFEGAGRTLKLAKLRIALDKKYPNASLRQKLQYIRAMQNSAWSNFARFAGVNNPSDETRLQLQAMLILENRRR